MTAHRSAVTKAQWQRGIAASRRLGRWLKVWEERARQLREAQEAAENPKDNRRRR
ncbi:MAG: hypothetical protein JWN32_1208 [Solirubrobacterales bacterium]|nr:hypothetical protein [Solirubrobacterales bacterium]